MRRGGEILRFCLVGVLVAAIYVVLYLGFLALGLPRMGANIAAFLIAVGVQYLGQAGFTFRRKVRDPEQFIRFSLMVLLGLASSALITGVIAPKIGLADWQAAAAVTVLLPVQNYVLMTLWVFSGRSSKRNSAV